MSLKQRIQLIEQDREWLNAAAKAYHYMHRPVHQRATPFGWAVTFDGELYQPDGKPSGFIIFASIHYTRLRGEFGYAGLPTKWQVLSLARLWLHDNLPRNSETVVISKCLRQTGHDRTALVQRRWLEVHPPVFLNEPYHIIKIISDADQYYHTGTIYEAANFREYKRDDGKPIISQKRHKNTRGSDLDGHELRRFVYDLKEPEWKYEPLAALPLFAPLFQVAR
jgi:hypothetical protein